MAYATLADLEARYGPVVDQRRATVLLDDAATMLDGLVAVDTSDAHQMDALKMVSCAMVNRSLLASSSDSFGVSQASYTMGPFTESATYANPSGDMYLTASERRLLGVGSVTIESIRPVIGGAYA